MCLGVPGRVIDVGDGVATVDFWGVQREVRLDIVDEPVSAGDYVLNHVGFAIRRIPDSEVAATMALYDELLAAASEEDLLAQDIRGELRAQPVLDPDSRRGSEPDAPVDSPPIARPIARPISRPISRPDPERGSER